MSYKFIFYTRLSKFVNYLLFGFTIYKYENVLVLGSTSGAFSLLRMILRLLPVISNQLVLLDFLTRISKVMPGK